jgi:hypothetical protein
MARIRTAAPERAVSRKRTFRARAGEGGADSIQQRPSGRVRRRYHHRPALAPEAFADGPAARTAQSVEYHVGLSDQGAFHAREQRAVTGARADGDREPGAAQLPLQGRPGPRRRRLQQH